MHTAPPETDLYLPLPAPDEHWDPHTIHTHYFGFQIPDHQIGAYIYVRYHPAFKLCQAGVHIHQGLHNIAHNDAAFTDYQITLPWPEISGQRIETANGLAIEFLELGRQVRLTYDSHDGRASFDVNQTALTPLIARGHVMPGEDEHHPNTPRPAGGTEQFMHCTGYLELDGERHAIDCHPIRDRSWSQIRTEDRLTLPPTGWTPMYFGPDLAFNQVGIEAPDTNPAWTGIYTVPDDHPTHHFGFIIVNGDLRELAHVRRDVLERQAKTHRALRQELAVEDEAGEIHHFTGEAISLAAVPTWPNLTSMDGVYRWYDDRGRSTCCVYQEVWSDTFHHDMNRRERVKTT
jgi:hypothetical protein